MKFQIFVSYGPIKMVHCKNEIQTWETPHLIITKINKYSRIKRLQSHFYHKTLRLISYGHGRALCAL
jgi:hypothetical protein